MYTTVTEEETSTSEYQHEWSKIIIFLFCSVLDTSETSTEDNYLKEISTTADFSAETTETKTDIVEHTSSLSTAHLIEETTIGKWHWKEFLFN